MNAKDLIGKRAIRTKPVTYGNGSIDRSYTADFCNILKATDDHIVIESTFKQGEVHILSWPFTDENWIDYDELIRLE